MINLERIVQMADEGPVGKGRREEERREEELLIKQQLAKEAADARREHNDLQNKLERDRLMAAHNKKLLEDQEKARRLAKEKENEQKILFKQLGKQHQDEIAQAKLADYERQLQYQKLLLQQIHNKQNDNEDMNVVEKSINCDTINHIREDNNFQGRLQHRIRMARGAGAEGSRPNTSGTKVKSNGWMM